MLVEQAARIALAFLIPLFFGLCASEACALRLRIGLGPFAKGALFDAP